MLKGENNDFVSSTKHVVYIASANQIVVIAKTK